MKLITVSKKKLGFLLMILGITIVICTLGRVFMNKLEFTVSSDENLNNLRQYSELGGSVKYEIPGSWQIVRQDTFGSEVLCHTDFKNKDGKINGFFQVWRSNGNLEKFLTNSKKISNKQNNLYKKYSLESKRMNGRKLYLIKYDMTKEIGGSYVGEEYFLEGNNRFYRFTFFVKEKDFSEAMSSLFERIVKTLKYN